MDGVERGAEPAFLGGFDDRLAGPEAVAFGDEFGDLRIAFRQLLRQRMMRRQGQERGAEQRIRTSGENLDCLLAAGDRELHPRAFRAADPILLHQANPLGPAVERLQRFEQFVAKRGDAQKPLR